MAIGNMKCGQASRLKSDSSSCDAVLIILLGAYFYQRFIKSISILIGLIVSTRHCWSHGLVDLTLSHRLPLSMCQPFYFGAQFSSIIMMCIIAAVSLVSQQGCASFLTLRKIKLITPACEMGIEQNAVLRWCLQYSRILLKCWLGQIIRYRTRLPIYAAGSDSPRPFAKIWSLV